MKLAHILFLFQTCDNTFKYISWIDVMVVVRLNVYKKAYTLHHNHAHCEYTL